MNAEIKKHKKAIDKALADPRTYRGEVNQANFWNKFGVTQSGGSRYENGRDMDKPLRTLIALDVMGHGDLVTELVALV